MKDSKKNEQLLKFMSKMECQAISEDEEDVKPKIEIIQNEKETLKKPQSPRRPVTPEIPISSIPPPPPPTSNNNSVNCSSNSNNNNVNNNNSNNNSVDMEISFDDDVSVCESEVKEILSNIGPLVFDEPELLLPCQNVLNVPVYQPTENTRWLKMDPKILREYVEYKKPTNKGGKINSLSFSGDGKYLMYADERSNLRIMNIPSWTIEKNIRFEKYGIKGASFLQDNYDIIHSSAKVSHAMRLYSLEENKYIRFFHGHEDEIVKFSLSPAGVLFISSSMDKTVKLWDIRCHHSYSTIKGFINPKVSYDYSGNFFGVVDDTKVVKLFDIRSYGRGILKMFVMDDERLDDKNRILDIQFSPKGKNFVLPTSGRSFASYDVITGGKVANYENVSIRADSQYSVEYSSCGSQIFVAYDNEISMFDVESGIMNNTLISQHRNGISQVKVHRKIMMMATAGNGVSLWGPNCKKIEKYKHDEEEREKVKYRRFLKDLNRKMRYGLSAEQADKMYGPLYVETSQERYEIVPPKLIKEENTDDIINVEMDCLIIENGGCLQNGTEINQNDVVENKEKEKTNVVRKKKIIKKKIRKSKVKKEAPKIFKEVDLITDDEESAEDEIIEEEVSEDELMEVDNAIVATN
uniref:WD_REPEATS_REGION domain-containing protein n=1 Tax=Parastrongyloides trichosuri TaxID=131310 RepID=A0A0N4Z3X2_PARTI